jgi:hypothetical protein
MHPQITKRANAAGSIGSLCIENRTESVVAKLVCLTNTAPFRPASLRNDFLRKAAKGSGFSVSVFVASSPAALYVGGDAAKAVGFGTPYSRRQKR